MFRASRVLVPRRVTSYTHIQTTRPTSSSIKSYQRAPMAAETDVQAEAVANTSGVTPESMKATLTEKLQAQFVAIRDESGAAPLYHSRCGCTLRHFATLPP